MLTRKTSRRLKGIGLTMLLSLVQCDLWAAEQSNPLEHFLQLSLAELAEIDVVAPTKTKTRLDSVPGSVTVITAEQIRRSPARTLPELLRTVPGVNVRWNPMVQTIDIRGFGSNPFTSRVLLLIDGVPFNSWNKGGFPQHPGLDFFNIDIVSKIEVSRGAGSALYGENAYNGVINIVTSNGGEDAGSRFSVQGGDRELQILSASHSTKISENADVIVAARHTQAQLPTELWMDNGSNAEGYDLYLKGRLKDFTLTYYRRQDSVEGYEYLVGSPDLPPGSVFRSADRIEQTINILSANYQRTTADERWQVSAAASLANRDGSHCTGCHAQAQDPAFQESADHGYQALGSAELLYRVNDRHRLMFGTEWRRLVTGDHAEELQGGLVPTMHAHPAQAVDAYSKGAFFLQDEMSLLDDQLLVTAGLRYDTRTSPGLFGDNWFPRLSLVHRTTDWLTLRGGWSRAARYPTFSELYQQGWFVAAESASAIIPLGNFESNVNLRPEFIESAELGFELTLNERWRLKADAFQNTIEDTIVIAYPRFRSENHPGNARVRGVEVALSGTPRRWLKTDLNWSYQSQQQVSDGVDSVGNPLEFTYAPRHKLNANVQLTPTPYLSISAQAQWRDKMLAPSFWYPIALGQAEPTPLPDYTYLDFRLDYRPPLGRSDGARPVTLSVIARNLLDERPYETLSGFGGRVAGREWRFEVAYQIAD